MPSIRLRIPDPLRIVLEGLDKLPKAAKQRLSQCLLALPDAIEKPPALISTTSCVIFLADDQQSALDVLANRHALSSPEAAVALMWTAMQPQLMARSTDALTANSPVMDSVNRQMGSASRPEQAQYYRGLEKFVLGDERGVLFAEGATGLGKTRSFLTALIAWCAAHPGSPAAIAVPTYQLMAQTMQEWRKMEHAGAMPSMRAILGQAAFVSQTALANWMASAAEEEETEEPGIKERVAAWVAGGAPPAPESRIICDASWTAEGLLYACGGEFDEIDDVLLAHRTDDEDAGFHAYRAQSVIADKDAQVTFLTHAMLAVMVRSHYRSARQSLDDDGRSSLQDAIAGWIAQSPEDREDRLVGVINETLARLDRQTLLNMPKLGLLIVDEAHQLEQWFASVNSLQVSVLSIIQSMKRLRTAHPKVPHAEIDRAMHLFDLMRAEASQPVNRENEHLRLIGALRECIRTVLQAIPKKSASSVDTRRLGAIGMMIDTVLRQHLKLQVANLTQAKLDWSGIRKFPRLAIGRRDVSRELDYLWRSLADKAVLASATLYDYVPQVSMESMRQLLAVPARMAIAMQPVQPEWVRSPVTVLTAALVQHPNGIPRFVRPKQGNDERHAVWVSDVTRYIAQAWNSSAGGMLVLLTAYDDLTAIREQLDATMSVRPGPVLAQRSGKPLEALKAAYSKAVQDGDRPMMLAVGGAWTGLDLTVEGHENALTDLVIPVAPFGATKTITHEYRVQRFGILSVAYAAAIVLKQGLGRLVRHPETPANRRIHFLDARQHMPEMAGLFAPIKRHLDRYTRKMTV
ncbi:TPA: type IV CRISPR-associated DEAD/DEAH-box helicase Csf4 [Burkholderia lata]